MLCFTAHILSVGSVTMMRSRSFENRTGCVVALVRYWKRLN